MNIAKHLYVVLFIVSTLGCKTKNTYTYQYKNSSVFNSKNENFDFSWNDTLDLYKDEMKKEWLNRTSPKNDFYDLYSANTVYNLPPSNINVSILQLLPISVYVINQTDFRNWEKEKPILDLLNLSKTKSKGFITNNKEFYFSIDFRLENGKWIFAEYEPIFKGYADQLSILYFDRKIDLFNI